MLAKMKTRRGEAVEESHRCPDCGSDEYVYNEYKQRWQCLACDNKPRRNMRSQGVPVDRSRDVTVERGAGGAQ